MPRRDGTGPTGIGSINGRGLGFGNSEIKGYSGLGRRFAGNRCRINNRKNYRWAQESEIDDERYILEIQKGKLENQLKLIEERLSSLN